MSMISEFVEKLIERLKKEQYDMLKPYAANDLASTMIAALDIAIEIVNQLAEEYSNDSCIWFKYDYRTMAPKNHDVGNPYWRIPENMDKLKFCPYCGKKIKVM